MTIHNILSRHADLAALVLDVGANKGIHGLYAAMLGYRVWAIEPQETHLMKTNFIIIFMFINTSIFQVSKNYLATTINKIFIVSANYLLTH